MSDAPPPPVRLAGVLRSENTIEMVPCNAAPNAGAAGVAGGQGGRQAAGGGSSIPPLVPVAAAAAAASSSSPSATFAAAANGAGTDDDDDGAGTAGDETTPRRQRPALVSSATLPLLPEAADPMQVDVDDQGKSDVSGGKEKRRGPGRPPRLKRRAQEMDEEDLAAETRELALQTGSRSLSKEKTRQQFKGWRAPESALSMTTKKRKVMNPQASTSIGHDQSATAHTAVASSRTNASAKAVSKEKRRGRGGRTFS